MANFQTHIISGVLVSGMGATVLIAGSLVTPMEAAALTITGAMGAILPDIDLEESRQSRYLFAGMGLFLGFLALFNHAMTYSILELWMLWLGVYILFRYIFWKAFNAYTVHRGVFHSLLSALFFSLATVVLFSKFLGQEDMLSWMAGLFLFLGFITHLVFDELYSVDFGGKRIKRSFGTAMKLFDYKNPFSAGLLVLGIAGFFYLTPSSENFRAVVISKDNWAYLHQRLLPYESWFGQEFTVQTSKNEKYEYLPIANNTTHSHQAPEHTSAID